MIDKTHELPVTRQAQLLDLSRSSVYYTPQAVSHEDLLLMRRIDELHMAHPFAGSRMLRGMLNAEGFEVGRRHVTTLMRRMGIQALYRGPRTSTPHPAHKIYPYLLRALTIDRPNQVWATDITYLPMAKGFVYLCAVLDWHTRRVLTWRLSNTLTEVAHRSRVATREESIQSFKPTAGSPFVHPDRFRGGGLTRRYTATA